jgi:hypothetical protein
MLYLLGSWLVLAVFIGAAIKLLVDRKGARRRIVIALYVLVGLGLAYVGLLLYRIETALRSVW